MSFGSLIDYESQKIKKTVLSTTVTELYSFMITPLVHASFSVDCGWDISGAVVNIHMRIGAKEPGSNSKNNSLALPKGDNPHDFLVAKGSLFRRYS